MGSKNKSFIRTGHGSTGEKLAVVEIPPHDELARPNQEELEERRNKNERQRKKRRGTNKVWYGKHGRRPPKLVSVRLWDSVARVADSRLEVALKYADEYRVHRMRELYEAWGFVSAGVANMVTSEATYTCFARYLDQLATETGDVELMSKSTTMWRMAQSSALAAWSMCERESAGRQAQEKRQELKDLFSDD